MKIYYGLGDKNLKKSRRSIAIGIFDGVHRGHQKILKKMLLESSKKNLRSMVVTFDPHPNRILKKEADPPIISSLQHRLRLFEKLSINETLVIRFDKKFSRMSRERFVKDCLVKKLGMASLSVGHDFRFGHRGQGNDVFLRSSARQLGFAFFAAKPLRSGREIISSTRIRALIEKGDFEKAAGMLGRPVSVYGDVVRGRGRGATIGFPTANLNPHHETLPPGGVYAVWGRWKGRKLKGVLHIGRRPTFGDGEPSVEAHFFNFHKNIYGNELELLFVKKLRPTRRFSSPQELVRAIRMDIQKASKSLG